MYVEAICPLCFASHIVPDEMRGESLRCEECEEEFIISKKAKRTSKQPPRMREVKAAEEVEEVAPVETADVLPEANLVDNAPKKKKPRAEDEEVLDIPDDAVQGGAPVVKTTPTPKRRREEDEEEDRPKKRRRDEDDDEDDRPRKKSKRPSGTPVGLIVGLIAGAVFLFGLIGISALWALSSKEDDKPQAQGNNPPANIAKPKPGENPEPPKKDPPKKDPPKKDPPKVDPPKADPPAVWNVKSDPSPAAVKIPAAFKKEIPAPGLVPEVVFPAASSPFVAIGSNRGAADERQVWNLQTGEMTGKVVGQISSTQHPVLSPDGEHLAYLSPARKGTIEIWAPASGKMVTALVGAHQTTDLIEFAGPDKLLFARLALRQMSVKVFDVATGIQEREFQTARPMGGRDSIAISPGGAYLALAERENLDVYEIKTGTLVGQRSFTKANALAPGACHGLSFSPDGSELAGLFFGTNGAQLICWDAIKGDLVSENAVPKAQPDALTLTAYRGHVIDWLGDRRGWLLFGYTLVDRGNSGSATFLAEPPANGSPVPRHLVGPGHSVTLQPATKVLTVGLFDPDKPQ
jgi:hypothetical protein